MIFFNERQKFRQWWIWALVILIVFVQCKLIYTAAFKHNFISSQIIWLSCINVFVILLLILARLDTAISDKGISYMFFPFQFKQRTIEWNQIESVFVRKYKPLTEYGGWGFRLGLFGKGRALNVSGNMGLQLKLKSGKRLLIGTAKSEEIEKVILRIREQKIFDDTIS